MTTEINKPKGKFKKCSFNDPFIYVEDNTLSKKFCKDVIAKFENDDRKSPAMVGGTKYNNFRVDPEVKLSTDLSFSRYSDWKKEDERFFRSINKSFEQYKKQLPKDLFHSDLMDTGYQIQRTNPGEFYIFHNDYQPYSSRCITFIWYLNTVKHDGYTEFIDGTRVQPKAGRLLMFPATWTYIHRGYPPKDEVKYICTGWISDKNGY